MIPPGHPVGRGGRIQRPFSREPSPPGKPVSCRSTERRRIGPVALSVPPKPTLGMGGVMIEPQSGSGLDGGENGVWCATPLGLNRIAGRCPRVAVLRPQPWAGGRERRRRRKADGLNGGMPSAFFEKGVWRGMRLARNAFGEECVWRGMRLARNAFSEECV